MFEPGFRPQTQRVLSNHSPRPSPVFENGLPGDSPSRHVASTHRSLIVGENEQHRLGIASGVPSQTGYTAMGDSPITWWTPWTAQVIELGGDENRLARADVLLFRKEPADASLRKVNIPAQLVDAMCSENASPVINKAREVERPKSEDASLKDGAGLYFIEIEPQNRPLTGKQCPILLEVELSSFGSAGSCRGRNTASWAERSGERPICNRLFELKSPASNRLSWNRRRRRDRGSGAWCWLRRCNIHRRRLFGCRFHSLARSNGRRQNDSARDRIDSIPRYTRRTANNTGRAIRRLRRTG